MTDIDYLPAQLAGLATGLRMMGRDNSADIAQRGAERVEQQARELEELRSAVEVAVNDLTSGLFDGLTGETLKDIAAPLAALVAPSVPETEETADHG